MDNILKDIRYGFRNLLKRPAFTTITIVTLALGIGANTAVFSMVNALLFRPRAVSQPEQLVEVFVGNKSMPYQGSSYPDYLVFREQRDVLSDLAGYRIDQFKLGGSENVEQVWGEAVTGNYFDVLGIHAFLGRTFAPEEGQTPGTHPVAVLSHSLWQRRFNSDPSVVGSTITLNQLALTVVGIAPPSYTGMIRGLSAEVWVPTMMLPQLHPQQGMGLLNSRGNQYLRGVGRLAPNVTLSQARARFDVVTQQLQNSFPDRWLERRRENGEIRPQFVSVMSESETRIPPDMKEIVYLAIALVLVMINLVLLIACMNLASLLLARGLARRREIAVRVALGAGRRQIVQQLLTESVMLAVFAGVAGTLLAVWLMTAAISFIPNLPEGIRLSLDLHMDWRVLFYTFGFSLLVGVVFGLIPAIQTSRADVLSNLKEGSETSAGGYRQSRLRNGLILTQVALSLLLLIAAGLAMRSVRNISPTRVGFDSPNLVVAPIMLEQHLYDRVRGQQFYKQLEERTRALAGVTAVGLVSELPGGVLGSERRSLRIEGYTPGPGEDMQVSNSMIGAGYLAAMSIPVIQGRDIDFRDVDASPCVALVNESFSRRYFRDGTALGKHLEKHDSEKPKQCEIVGVVRDDKVQTLQKEPLPWCAFAIQQSHVSRATMIVESSVAPESMVAAVRREIRALDPTIPVSDVSTLSDAFAPVLYVYSLFGTVIGACGILAGLLALLGIYGTVAYGVGQRTREIGIRIALGADNRDILRLVSKQVLFMVAFGLSFGVLLALVFARVLASVDVGVDLLWGVSPADPLTFAVVIASLTVVALAACYVPALKATKVDPMVALRYE